MLHQFGDEQLERGDATALGIDLHPDNVPAIRVFGKAGFTAETGTG